jgi:hypothetical protein
MIPFSCEGDVFLKRAFAKNEFKEPLLKITIPNNKN